MQKIINDSIIDYRTLLDSANKCRRSLSSFPDNKEAIQELAEIESTADSFYSIRIRDLEEANNYNEALSAAFEWLEIVGERNDIYQRIQEITEKRHSYNLAVKRNRDEQIGQIQMDIKNYANIKKYKSCFRKVDDLLVIEPSPDDDILDFIRYTAETYIIHKKKRALKWLLSNIFVLAAGLVIFLISIIQLSSDIGFLAGLFTMAASGLSFFLLLIFFILPNPALKAIASINNIKPEKDK